MTWTEKRLLMKRRYHLVVGPMVLLLAVSLASSEPSSVLLASLSGFLLVALTINRFFR
ncbi:hypothetical protein BH09PSE1_BH09PSE1_25130 [soil metagenome]